MKIVKITTDNTEIQRIIRDYCQQLYANKKDNQRNGTNSDKSTRGKNIT